MYGSPANHNEIVGNFIGTNAAATFGAPGYVAGGHGVEMQQGASKNVIGKPGAANRNVISGNYQHGVATYNYGTADNMIQNNIIGLTPDGTAALPNRSHGVDINTLTTGTMIGGMGDGERNVVSGNEQNGVEISHNPGTSGNYVVGNYIGAAANGASAPLYARNKEYAVNLEGEGQCDTSCPPDAGFNFVNGNVLVNSGFGGLLIDKGQHGNAATNNLVGVLPNGTAAGNVLFGVRVEKGAFDNTIGPGNEIAFNGRGSQEPGAQVLPDGHDPTSTAPVPTYNNTFTKNSIHDNSGLGIDLAPLGPSTSADPLVNHGIATPVITAATPQAVVVQACPNCTVELFGADSPAGSYGEGKTYITSGTADATGMATLTIPSASTDKVVTVTATSPSGDTSEFSKNVALSALPTLP